MGQPPPRGQSVGLVKITGKVSLPDDRVLIHYAPIDTLGGGYAIVSAEAGEYFVIGELYDLSFTTP